ncbi:MAG: HAD family phosphatase [Saprospiraceae bacterium]|nr:HAD family phosphatase [Saprospiraceae bacterium]
MIETIIFDLGGVLIDWNPRYLYRQIFDDEAKMEDFLTNVTTMDWNEQQDAGYLIADATSELIAKHPEFEAEIQAYYGRWTEMLKGAIQETVDILTEIYKGKKYRLYALTNWSGELFPYALKRYDFLQYFEGIVVSGDEKMKKPDIRIYDLILDRYEITPEKAIFIDDNERNIKAAKTIGLKTIHFKSAEQARKEFEAFGVL